MKLNLDKDICVLDLETTGTSICKDRIVQISILKVFADGRPDEVRTRLLNPTIQIPKEATNVHGITNEMVQDQPTFAQISRGLLAFIGDSDLLGYNSNRFDIPLLMEEFERSGLQLDLTNRRTMDAMRIFHKMEPRDLSAAVKFYVGKEFNGAHNAENDVKATLEVFKAQIEKYNQVEITDESGRVYIPVMNNMDSIQDFTNDPNEVDFAGKIVYNSERVPVFNFGKYQGKPVGESCANDAKYHAWIINGDFPKETKRIIDRLVLEFKNINENQL
jgi:DNA polymerase III subunit epsilon